MQENKKGLISVHIAVLLFGVSGLFAKMVDLPSIVITFGRVLFSSVFLFIMLRIRKAEMKLNCGRDYAALFMSGIILAIHWTTFSLSIQLSTVAVGTITFSTYPLFVTFLEPYLFQEKLKGSSIVSAVIMLAGVLFIVPEFELTNSMTQGILWGMVCSLSYAVLSLWNRRFANTYSGSIVSFYEQGAAAMVLLPVMFFIKPKISGMDVAGLVVYGVICTAVAHSLFIEGLKHIRVQTAGIISGLESVYGIVLAAILLREFPSARELIGGGIILSVVFYTTIKKMVTVQP